jgi:hypothetical protein
MASTRTDARTALADVARDGARIQIAAFTAAARALVDWAKASDRLAHAIADELLRRVDGESDNADLVVRVSSATSAHLHELTALLRAAADHFESRLGRSR